MKRTVLVSVSLLLAILLFADEALLIPVGVLRVSPTAGFTFSMVEYDGGGTRAHFDYILSKNFNINLF